jgi:hypothetical protein
MPPVDARSTMSIATRLRPPRMARRSDRGRRAVARSVAACTAALIASVGFPGTTLAETKHARSRCAVYRCTTLARDAQVRVVQVRARHQIERGYQSTFAEWLPGRRTTPLGDRLGTTTAVNLGPLALSGRFVAYALQSIAKEGPSSWRVCRLDARSGRRESVEAVGPAENAYEPGAPGVTDVVVTSAGSVAWLAGGAGAHPGVYTVFELARGSMTPTALATGPGIMPGSLAAVPGHLYWTEGGTARMAPAA